MIDLVVTDKSAQQKAEKIVESHWDTSLAPFILEVLFLMDPGDPRATRLWKLLERTTREKRTRRVDEWLQWMWHQEFEMHPGYPTYKAGLYASIDRRLSDFFGAGMKHTIRLDEILLGGVHVFGISLEHPKVIEAGEANYLGEKNVVFGVYINGEARAYPKRILAWHELFSDTVGGVDVTCAYCTLCGSAVLYRQTIGSRKFDFETSGFLYRSNKTHVRSPDAIALVIPGRGTGDGGTRRFRAEAGTPSHRNDYLANLAGTPPGHQGAVAGNRF